jgi:putative ABC transport system permease protein
VIAAAGLDPRRAIGLGGVDLLLLVLAGLAIAMAGAIGPAGWAARTRTSTVLHTE